MASSSEVRVRTARRFRFAGVGVLPVSIQGVDRALSLVDLSESGACFYGEGLPSSLKEMVAQRTVRIGSSPDHVELSIAKGVRTTPQSVAVTFDAARWEQSGKWIRESVERNVLVGDLVSGLIDEIDERVATVTEVHDHALVNARDLAAWIRLNKLNGDEARAALRLAAWALDDRHLLHRRRFVDLTLGPLKRIRALDRTVNIHCVSMRMPRIFADKVWRRLFEGDLKLEGVEYLGNLAELKRQASAASDRKRWLVGVDVFVNRGQTRDAFLKTVLDEKDLVAAYEGVFVVAPMAYEDAVETGFEVPSRFRRGDVTRVGETFRKNERPPLHWPSTISEEDRRILATLHQRLHSGLQFLDEGDRPFRGGRRRRPHGQAQMAPDHGASLATFYYGCPPYNPPLLWSESNNWTPLFKTVDFYVPTARPFPRAPIFNAYPRTLAALRRLVRRGGPVLLHAPGGAGKTFLAARAIEVERSNSYALWHDCLELETIDNILEEIDKFLEALGISPWLVREWVQGDNRVDELAGKLLRIFSGLDRSVLLVFDGMQRLFSHADSDKDSRVLQFMRALSPGIRSTPSERGGEDSSASSGTVTSIVFLLQTHPDTDSHGRPSPVTDDEIVERVRRTLKLETKDLLEHPIGDKDVFVDPVPLARRLLERTALSEKEKRYVRLFTHQDPYKTWLVTFCLRRAARHWHAKLPRLNRSRYYGELALHHTAQRFLSDKEIFLLQVASAFFLPWSITDIETVLAGVGRPAVGAGDVVAKLLQDNAPFVIRLNTAEEPDGLVNHRLRNPTQLYLRDQFEMPTVSARFFQRALDKHTDLATSVYRALARLMYDRWERSKGDRGRTEETSASAQVHRQDTTSLVEHIRYLCLAGDLGKAAQSYWEEKKSLGWERSRRLGRQILDAAHPGDEVRGEGGRPALSPREECLVRATYGRSLAELMELSLARQCLQKGPWFHRAQPLEQARVLFEQARCEQYAGNIKAAADRFEEAKTLVDDETSADALILSCESRLALGQCAMTRGQLSEARRCVVSARNGLDNRVGSAEQHRLNLKAERHQGTLDLLAGRTDLAKQTFKDLAGRNRGGGDGRAIACYKRARAAMEEARVLGAWQRVMTCAHLQPRIEDLLDEASGALKEARSTLERALPLDARWHSAAHGLGELECGLLRRRYRAVTDRVDSAAGADEDLVDLRNRLEDARNGMEIGEPTSRKLEVGYLAAAVECEKDLAELASNDTADREALARLWEHRFARVVESYSDSPYQRGRAFCERLEFLYRLRDGVELHEPIDMSMTNAYRQGEQAYLDIDVGLDENNRRKPSRACEALQVLATGIYGATYGLQERFEAALWFEWWEVTKPPCAVCGSGVVAPMSELDNLLEQRLRSPQGGGEKYLTIPAKVYCDLTRDFQTYERLKTGSWSPRLRPELKDCNSREKLEEKLRWDVASWVSQFQTSESIERFSLQRGINASDGDRSATLRAIKDLAAWFAL